MRIDQSSPAFQVPVYTTKIIQLNCMKLVGKSMKVKYTYHTYVRRSAHEFIIKLQQLQLQTCQGKESQSERRLAFDQKCQFQNNVGSHSMAVLLAVGTPASGGVS